jgi:hypothetical protein
VLALPEDGGSGTPCDQRTIGGFAGMAKKVGSKKAGKKSQRAKADKAIASASANAAKVAKAVHQAVVKALPKAKVGALNVGNAPQLALAPAQPAGAGGPGTIEPKLSVYLVFVISL